MSGKLKNFWRNVKDYLELAMIFVEIAIVATVMIIFAMLLTSLIFGAIISVCWNIAMPFMFGFSKITIIQAIILSYAISGIRCGYFSNAIVEYRKCEEEVNKKGKYGTGVKVFAALVVVAIYAISTSISVAAIMYSWNNILPYLLNVELVKINFIQAFGFGYVFYKLIGFAKNTNSKKKEKNIEKEN